jgi:putative intracellular protease/amidase
MAPVASPIVSPAVQSFSLFTFLFSPAPQPSPGRIDVLQSVNALPPDVVGRFRDPMGFAKVPGGPYYVFDRRGHSVHTVDERSGGVRTLVEIGGEEGRLLDPSAFDVAADGSFAVADAPGGRERVQVFGPAGIRIGGFTRPGRTAARVGLGSLVLSGVGSLVYTGRSIVLSEPDTGWLITEHTTLGTPIRSIGQLRPTGQEDDREVHLALNAGLALPEPSGGFFFVFLAGTPAIRKYDASGALVFERVVQGRELDELLASRPQRWPRRTVGDREVPLVPPVVRTAAVDPEGRLWVAFVLPYTYVYDAEGEKIRTVQFRAAGVVAATSLAFIGSNQVLITPGCYEYAY